MVAMGFMVDNHTLTLGFALALGWLSTINPWLPCSNCNITPLPQIISLKRCCVTQLQWVLRHTAVVGAALHSCSGCCITQLQWVLRHTAAVGAPSHSCSGCCVTQLQWVLRYTAVVSAALHSCSGLQVEMIEKHKCLQKIQHLCSFSLQRKRRSQSMHTSTKHNDE